MHRACCALADQSRESLTSFAWRLRPAAAVDLDTVEAIVHLWSGISGRRALLFSLELLLAESIHMAPAAATAPCGRIAGGSPFLRGHNSRRSSSLVRQPRQLYRSAEARHQQRDPVLLRCEASSPNSSSSSSSSDVVAANKPGMRMLYAPASFNELIL
jgi:hypothetical protein